MKSSSTKFKKLTWLFIFMLLFSLLSPAGILRAADEFKLSETKLTLYQGNTYQLEYSGVEKSDAAESDWDGWGWSSPSFVSSDTSVAVVDYNGLVRAVGVGTATITAYYNGQMDSCTVKVRKNRCELDQEEILLYQGQEATVTLTGKKKAKSYSYYICSADENTWASDYDLEPESLGKGRFHLQANTVGTYYVDFVLNATDGKDYSARCKVEVQPCGLKSAYLAVANGGKAQIVLENAMFLSCEMEQEALQDDEADEETAGAEEADGENNSVLEEEWDIYSEKAEVSVSKKGVITAKKPGSTKILINYETAYHEMKTETLTIHVTEPDYLPFESHLWAGDSYAPQFSGISPYSVITAAVKDENLIRTENWGGNDYLIPQEAGKTTITVSADGVSFTQEVTVINPCLSAYNMVLKTGKKKKLDLTGIEEDCKVTFSSSDKTVATVTKTGRITAKEKGAALITVTVDQRKLYCTVCVGTGTGLTAVQKAEAVLGADYSQEKRMQKGYYDCSSLTWRSYHEAGLALVGMNSAPTAAELARKLELEGKAIAFEYVSPDELLPGDIIFYQGSGNGRYKNIDHVAIYYGANFEPSWWDGELYNTGMIIHAAGNVHMRQYAYYRTDDIVVIARPVE